MGSKHFKIFINQQIDSFINSFSQDSNSLFRNDENKLIHPGEYGMYKEKSFRILLQNILNKNFSVTDGFIITSKKDHISTQCDILVINSMTRPLITDGIANFYPVEDVVAIGEIKSNLSKNDFKNALRKLAENKKLSDERKNQISGSAFKNDGYIPSFLVCNDLNFEIDSIDFKEIYEDIPSQYWHNIILCLNKGAILYSLELNKLSNEDLKLYNERGFNIKDGKCSWPYSQHGFCSHKSITDCPMKFITARQSDKYEHILYFLTALISTIERSTKYDFDSIEYLDLKSTSLLAK